jgi:hypothetical protein
MNNLQRLVPSENNTLHANISREQCYFFILTNTLHANISREQCYFFILTLLNFFHK